MKHHFIIDTDSYSGNFERPLTAYVTGCTGECGIGSEEAALFRYECGNEWLDKMENMVDTWVPDDHGCHRPTRIWPTPGFFNDGIGNHYPDSMWGSPEVLKRYEEEAAKGDLPEKMTKYPAYQSVAIHLYREPTEDERNFMVERAHKFARLVSEKKDERDLPGAWATPFKILGFRVILERTVEDILWESK